MKRLVVVAALAAALLGAALTASASSPTPISRIDWEQNQRVDFAWRANAVPPALNLSTRAAAATNFSLAPPPVTAACITFVLPVAKLNSSVLKARMAGTGRPKLAARTLPSRC